MGEQTGISWTHHTFNPWWGCVEVSPACGLPLKGDEDKPHGTCYAKVLDARFPILGQTHWGKDRPRRFFGDRHWNEPLKWDRAAAKAGERRRVFCGSMCDVMETHPDLQPHRTRLYSLVDKTPNLDWLFLTKRPQDYRRFLPALWLEHPPNNLWLGTTVETPEYIWRADELRKLKAVVRFISVEPMLAEFTEEQLVKLLSGLDWAIFGGESGKHARSSDLTWFADGLRRSIELGPRPYMKQIGAKPTYCGDLLLPPFKDKAGADPEEWPSMLRVQAFPTPRRFTL